MSDPAPARRWAYTSVAQATLRDTDGPGDGRLVVEGRSVQVQYDFGAKSSIPLEGARRRMVEAELTA